MPKADTLEKQYVPAEHEPAIARKWVEVDAFHADPDDPGTPYSIVIPPPNVTAALHMGHALNNTLQDILTRYHRMRGCNTIWLPGTDHAGIATQTVVEKRVLQEEGKRRTDFERDAFIAKIQAWKDEYEQRITNQLQAMGCSCDWDRQAFTLDEPRARAVREAFFQLFKDGLIYRGKRLVNWDPATQTALADDEVEMQDIDGHFYYMNYPLVDEHGNDTGEHVTVATTRPETMLGDTAVAVNPNDEQRKHFVGQSVRLPIVNRIIPIIDDDYVVIPDPESDDSKAKFASGFLKVTPAHDPNDYEIGQRHDLDQINVMAPDATISKDHGWSDFEENIHEAAAFLGLDRFEARKAIVSWFRENNLLEEVKPYRHAVGHSYRSHVPIEPYLSDQWYVKVTDDRLADAALRAMDASQYDATTESAQARGQQSPGVTEPQATGLKFFPDRYAKTFQTWHENIRDWCISRQLWWGHRIPVWSSLPGFSRDIGDELEKKTNKWEQEGRIAELLPGGDPGNWADQWYICVRSKDDSEIINYLESIGFTQDPDVLDTWFSSALWPMSTLGWPEQTPELEKWNPTSVLCTAREIITLWVSRMVMFNLYFKNHLPFKDVFIHAMIQDGHGQKMSKSLGNGVDPMDIIHSHGSDAMRFTLASMTTHTQDVRMPVDTVCPHTGKPFTPRFITTTGGGSYQVAAPVQDSPFAKGKKMVTSFGVASGQAQPSDEVPLARNTSEKFDLGRNFANKVWNAVRFALSHLEDRYQAYRPDEPGHIGPRLSELTLVDHWILSRLHHTVRTVDKALEQYEFATYSQALYDFFWRDLCDWYIEAIKPTVSESLAQRYVLATCLDVSLRLMHPVMPFVTERLYAALNTVFPQRGVEGIALRAERLLVTAPWPSVDKVCSSEESENEFSRVQLVVSMIREVRTNMKVPPREKVDVSAKIDPEVLVPALMEGALVEYLANVNVVEMGSDTAKPENAAVVVRPRVEVYLHNQLDVDAEMERLTKRRDEVQKSIQTLNGRLGNEKYVNKAPAHLVQQTRDQLADAEKELVGLEQQLAELG